AAHPAWCPSSVPVSSVGHASSPRKAVGYTRRLDEPSTVPCASGIRPPFRPPGVAVNSSRIGLNRRDLLRFRSLPAESAAAGEPVRRPGCASDLLRVHRPAMGSSFEVRLPAGAPGAVDLACRALDLIDTLEARLTVYRDDSEVSRLNAAAHLGPVEVEEGL